ncbi:hypothetical protein JKG47_00360 [Acidithiobacillus sp. MC6.1]|nr:hypothetical protein [Acidithiobacillus sp. MC6.1]
MNGERTDDQDDEIPEYLEPHDATKPPHDDRDDAQERLAACTGLAASGLVPSAGPDDRQDSNENLRPSETFTRLTELHQQMLIATYSREFLGIKSEIKERLHKMDADMNRFREILEGLPKLVESNETMQRDLQVMMAQNRQFLADILNKEKDDLQKLLSSQKEELKRIVISAHDPLERLNTLLDEQITVFRGFRKFAENALLLLIVTTLLGTFVGGLLANAIFR